VLQTSPSRWLLTAALALGSLGATGCAASPPLDLPLPKDARVVELLGDYTSFHKSPTNRYAIVLRGQVFAAPKGPFRISTTEDVRREGTPIPDAYVESDIDQITRLLVSKGYDVYRADMGEVSPSDVAKLIEDIGMVADAGTRTFFAYSGEGDRHGLRTRSMIVEGNRHLVPPDATIVPDALMEKLAIVKGTKALLVNACESGIFADAARKDPDFQGVVVAACAQGYATTPYEPAGTSSIYASFLRLYSDDPTVVRNLSTARIEKAGGTWTNLAHRWSDFWSGGGLPISYDPVVFSNGDFLF
jgi:hypothetical protein